MTIQPALPSEGYVRLKQVLAVFPVSKSKWYDGVRSGEYPQPVRLGPRASGYNVKEVRALLTRIAEQR
jgi:predicted DNA-binding transcriptional regulator AlpA